MSTKKRNIFKPLFSHTKNERIGILVLATIIVILFIIPSLFPNSNNKSINQKNWTELTTRVDKFEDEFAITNKNGSPVLFSFDPNTCDSITFCKLGFSPAQTTSILHYRNKGGKFKTPNDFSKLYVVSDSVFNNLKPYIDINTPKDTNDSEKMIELNSADTTTLQSLDGIGSYYANKIIDRRNKLGGFVSVSQLLEIYGIDDNRLNGFKSRIKINASLIRKININTSKASILRAHPYFNPQIVQNITKLRVNAGIIESTDQLIEKGILTQQQAAQIKPYLEF